MRKLNATNSHPANKWSGSGLESTHQLRWEAMAEAVTGFGHGIQWNKGVVTETVEAEVCAVWISPPNRTEIVSGDLGWGSGACISDIQHHRPPSTQDKCCSAGREPQLQNPTARICIPVL